MLEIDKILISLKAAEEWDIQGSSILSVRSNIKALHKMWVTDLLQFVMPALLGVP